MIEQIIQLLKAIVTDQFYGSITLKFESGKLVHITETRNYKPVKGE